MLLLPERKDIKAFIYQFTPRSSELFILFSEDFLFFLYAILCEYIPAQVPTVIRE